ncbi:MAG: Lrp/AsnC ligand binding domain-containing protein [Thermoplasmata archaeon]|nr:Lrp/AsnC ligand binding domain-containing protein [Thermoplasmata archaeon]
MMTCFVLINVEAKKEDEVYDALVAVKEIEGIREVFGQYDLICRIEGKNLREIRKLIINQIRSVPGVITTTSLITSE